MYKVGITGGIGSGKSYVGRMFATLGVPIYIADIEAKRLMYRDKALKAAIKALLGSAAYHPNGRIDRAYIASQIFGDKALLAQINALVHPAVAQDFARWAEHQDGPYVLEESAILFENGIHMYFDATLLITAPEALRISRVMKRDGATSSKVKARMAHQWPDEKKKALATFVIHNDEFSDLDSQVKETHHAILKLAKKK